jgi:hypothetical protein
VQAAIASVVVVVAFWAMRLVWGDGRGFGNSDLYAYFLPMYQATYERFGRGEVPLWNPYQLCGIPWLATLQAGTFYPPHVLYLLLEAPLALAVSGLLHLLLGAVGTILLARRVGLSGVAAALAAFLFTLRGHLPGLLLSPAALEATAWFPLGCVATLDIARGHLQRGTVILSATLAASWLAGYPQPTIYSVYAWAALFLAFLLTARGRPGAWLASGAAFAAALVLGTSAAAVQLLPAAELVRVGTRDAGRLTADVMYPLGGPYLGNPALLLLLQEGLSGTLRSFGVLALSLVPAALFARRQRPLVIWGYVVGAACLLYALGPITAVFPLLVELPLLGAFRAPNRALFVVDFCVAVLAAAGLESIRRGRRALAARLTTLAALLGLAYLVAADYGVADGRTQPALVTGTLMVLVVATLWRRVPSSARTVGGAVVAIALVEITLARPLGLLLPYASEAGAIYHTHGELYRQLAQLAGSSARVWILGAVGAFEMSPKVATLFRLRSLDDYEPVNLRRQAEYLTYLTDGSTTLERFPFVFGGLVRTVAAPGRVPLATRRRLLDVAAVRYVVIHANVLAREEVQQMIESAGLRRLLAFGAHPAVFENPHAVPRAFVTYRASAAPPAEPLLARMSQHDFDPLRESYVEETTLAPAPDAPARGAAATIVQDDEEIVEIEATLSATGLLVLADSFYPGWRATVNGVPAPIRATNHLFRGVYLPAGTHRVRFEYRPWSFSVGAAASLAALACLATLLGMRAGWRRVRGRC